MQACSIFVVVAIVVVVSPNKDSLYKVHACSVVVVVVVFEPGLNTSSITKCRKRTRSTKCKLVVVVVVVVVDFVVVVP